MPAGRALSTRRQSRRYRTARPTQAPTRRNADDNRVDARWNAGARGTQRADRNCARLRGHDRHRRHPGTAYAAEPGAGDVRRRLEFSAACDSPVHPVRRDHERLVDVAALGTILIPAMKNRGYSKEVAAATMSSAASLAIIIPPSIPMVLYAVMAQTSVVKLFVAGII